jgi:hypothetical protein
MEELHKIYQSLERLGQSNTMQSIFNKILLNAVTLLIKDKISCIQCGHRINNSKRTDGFCSNDCRNDYFSND